MSIALAAGGCPGGGSSRHGAEEHHRLLPAVERDGLRDGLGRRGSARHSADRTLTPPHSLSLSPSLLLCLYLRLQGRKLKRWRVRRKEGAGSVRRKEKSEEHPRPRHRRVKRSYGVKSLSLSAPGAITTITRHIYWWNECICFEREKRTFMCICVKNKPIHRNI